MTTRERLEVGRGLLELIDQRRTESGNPGIGLCIEQTVLERELALLEADILADPGALAAFLDRGRQTVTVSAIRLRTSR